MKLFALVLFALSTLTSWAFANSTQQQIPEQIYSGVVSDATGVFAQKNSQSCILKISQIDTDEVIFSVSINDEPTFNEQIKLKRRGSPKLFTKVLADYSAAGITSNEICPSDWSHSQAKCLSEVEHILNIKQKSETEMTHIEYIRYKNLYEIGGFALSSNRLECQLTLSGQ